MRTNQRDPATRRSTFTQLKRRDQLVECTIDSIVELGFPRTSVAEVARRAGVSKGVVTYHFAAKDDLILAVIAEVIGSMATYLEPRWRAADPAQSPERFIAPYISSWVDFCRSHLREVLALVRIYNAFRDESGRPSAAFEARAGEVVLVTQILQNGQARGGLGAFDAGIVAAVMKAALDDLMIQCADNPTLDLQVYGAELVAMFERATSPGLHSSTTDVPGQQPAPAAHPTNGATTEEGQ